MTTLRVWWIPNIPGKPFHYPVESVEEAKKVLDLLAKYDLFLDDLISSNAGGLERRFDNQPGFKPDDIDPSYADPDGTYWEEWEDENGDNVHNSELPMP